MHRPDMFERVTSRILDGCVRRCPRVRWREAITLRRLAGALVVVMILSAGAGAQTYPSRTVHLVVPFPPGGSVDAVARIIAEGMGEGLGQPVIVEHRQGAGGNVGADFVAKAKPDGHVLLMGTVGTHAINQSLYSRMPYDAVRDFAPVTVVSSTYNVVVVHPSVPVSSLKELIAYAKAKPGTLNFASGGSGTTSHLLGEMFKTVTGSQMVHVPYRGVGPAVTNLLGGHTQIMFTNLLVALPHIKAGKLRALAVTNPARTAIMPDLPTFAELGFAGFEQTPFWIGVLAPAGTPREIVGRLHAEIVKVLRRPAVRERFAALDAEPVGNTPEEFGALVRTDIAKWAKLVRDSGARVD